VIVSTERGLYCPAGGFYIDPRRPVGRAVITHGHSDHAATTIGSMPDTASPPRFRTPTPVLDWFRARGWKPAAYQRRAWAAYLAGQSGLIHAPTGTGKTQAAWLGPVIEALRERSSGNDETSIGSLPGAGAGAIRVVWVTPLRALAEDTTLNLTEPVIDLALPWTVQKRTGDTPQSTKSKQRRRLPTCLVTTPESLSLLLSYGDVAEQFKTLRCVVVDEWHELMSTKRGVQTELCLARLRGIVRDASSTPGVNTPRALQTWGLSATLGNTAEAMRVLLGPRDADDGVLIAGKARKKVAVRTLMPPAIERFPWAGHLGIKLVEPVCEAIGQAETSLLFTNTRSQCELWFQSILRARPQWLGELAMHHGSIDRGIRDRAEHMLRAGELRCVVCTSSLDLGVDFTPVDRVFQVGSPKGIARLMQRAGRSGHQPGAVSEVVGVPTNAFELVEFAATRDAIAAKRLESRQPLVRALDVLVQHLVTAALGGGFVAEAMLDEVRGTHAYARLTDAQWAWAVDFIVRGGPTLTAYDQYAKVAPPPADDPGGRYTATKRRVAQLHRMAIGTITSDAAVAIKGQGGKHYGTVEESFIGRLRIGDRFIFAGQTFELLRVRDLTATVKKATRPSRNVPRWQGGKSPLSTQLADAVRAKLDEARQGSFRGPEMRRVRPLLELQRQWSLIPAPDELLIERHTTRVGEHVYLFPFAGRLVHEGLAALLAHRVTRRSPISVTSVGNDYGIELLSDQPIDLDRDTWRGLFDPADLQADLIECLNSAGLSRNRFRQIARVAGLVFPGYPGGAKTAKQLQASASLFFDVFRQFDPDNALLSQAEDEVLQQELELRRTRATLARMRSATIRQTAPPRLTPLAFPLWAETIRESRLTSEPWETRVAKMAAELEEAAQNNEDGTADGRG